MAAFTILMALLLFGYGLMAVLGVYNIISKALFTEIAPPVLLEFTMMSQVI
jgi:hypothetical protein